LSTSAGGEYGQVLSGLLQAVVDRDLDRILSFFEPDVTFVDGASGEITQGVESIQAVMDDIWSSFSGFTPRLESVVVQGDTVAALIDTSAIHTGVYEGLPATGIAIRWLASAHYLFDPQSKRIRREAYYFDADLVTQRLRAAVTEH
jgi:ketosteroid isomerase-like protein